METGNAIGSGNTTLKEIQALGNFVIEVTIKLVNDIYKNEFTPNYLLKSICIVLPKNVGALECEDLRIINCMSHMSKLFLRLIIGSVRSKIKAEICDEQCEHVEGKGTNNVKQCHIYYQDTIGGSYK